MIINSTLNQLIIFDASADVPITSTILIKKKSEHIRKLPISEIWTTDISKNFLQSLALRIIEVWLYINGSVFSKARYMNGVGFEILTRTLVPQSPLSSPYPPRPLPTPLSPTPRVQKMAVSQVFFWKGWYEILILLTSVRACFNWAFSGSLFGLGRKREFRCFSPVSENHSYSGRNSNVL